MCLAFKGEHQIYRTIDILMKQGTILFEKNKPDLALSIFTEMVNLAPRAEGIQMAHEYRAQCYFIQVRVDLVQTKVIIFQLV